jgi:ABC-type Fe3+ transport system permease subunit
MIIYIILFIIALILNIMLLYIRTFTYDSGRHDKRVYNIKVWHLLLDIIILFIPFANIIIPLVFLIITWIDYSDTQYHLKNNSKFITKIYNFLNKEIWKQ